MNHKKKRETKNKTGLNLWKLNTEVRTKIEKNKEYGRRSRAVGCPNQCCKFVLTCLFLMLQI